MHSWNQARKLGAEIEQLYCAKRNAGRVCGEGCSFRCSECGNTTCQCRCSPVCPDAPRALSTDPERHQIELRILPLVFAMKRLRIFDPCWSCEGHLAADGSLWKWPMVWFYCSSMTYLRLLKESLNQLRLTGKTNAQWEVIVTYSDPDNPDTTFSIQPLAPGDSVISLPSLHADVCEIAQALDATMEDRARAIAANLAL